MTRCLTLVWAAMAASVANAADSGGCCNACGAAPCGPACVSPGGDCCAASAGDCCQPCFETVECTILVPQQVTEYRTVTRTAYRQEQRERTFTVYKQVPRTESRTRTVNYFVNEQRTREESYTTYNTEWEDRQQTYTVQVPRHGAAAGNADHTPAPVGGSYAGIHCAGSLHRSTNRNPHGVGHGE
jgi:hypothetical protein